jgi:pyoverdine/dityrosine biosynthesis protein
MRLDQDPVSDGVYKAGLDRIQEAVISSHFMHELANNAELELYDEDEFAAKSLEIDAAAVIDSLLPGMLSACNAFCRDRAAAAKPRARENYAKYGLDDPREVGIAQFITEVMFDRQYLRGPRERCSRELLCSKVKARIEAGSPIDMVIPALPFKFSSPLKTRGRLPDLAEVNFILGLYEILATVELIYREARPDLRGRLAGFTIVSDGSRFNNLVNEPDTVVDEYRAQLSLWIERLGLEGYITLFDYSALLRDRLPAFVWKAKSAIASAARREYADLLWPIFDPYDMAATIRAAARLEPDPEYSNPDGRVVSLLKSLVYTINYKTLEKLERLPTRDYRALYRDLTSPIFEPYAILSPSEHQSFHEEADPGAKFAPTDMVKEYLRQSMLREAWNAAIGYMAEIKSDRELAEDPILTCLPDHFRWTIHAKSGQLAVLTPTALGTPVQAWAGAAVFKRTKKNKVKLCTLPVLALEGAGAIPVRVRAGGIDDALALAGQPLFYIYPDVAFADCDEFLSTIRRSLVRTRTN